MFFNLGSAEPPSSLKIFLGSTKYPKVRVGQVKTGKAWCELSTMGFRQIFLGSFGFRDHKQVEKHWCNVRICKNNLNHKNLTEILKFICKSTLSSLSTLSIGSRCYVRLDILRQFKTDFDFDCQKVSFLRKKSS